MLGEAELSISGDIHGTAVNHKLLKVKGLRDRKIGLIVRTSSSKPWAYDTWVGVASEPSWIS